ncbi:histidinol-phosphate transaminase [Flavobacterium amniphilum]|uniref:histidinol-phosphate transaminase n=1 Tax=Flavobacterium amniphilum TaxID=1834035 RepID=UPI00202A670C|nr:histidinol-phosphate transaminase [Flavobacterium amniphilum]MCL9804301.1 histidinol-phosphate transaminase [Flavobacterium amniphilum]
MEINQLVRKNIAAMEAYSSARDEFKNFDKEMIFLDANENPFDNGINRYPDPQQKKLKHQLSVLKNIPESQILLGNGSDEVLDLLIRAFCEPNRDNVITLPPTYGMYGVLANLNAVENREVILLDSFQPDIDKILEVIDNNTKIIFICSPNNPTGNLIEEDKTITLLENFNGLIVLDEAYIDFSDAESWILKLENYKQLVVTQTLSKAYGMAGIRLGILYASEEIIDVLNKIKPPYNVNALTQLEAIKRLNKNQVAKDEIVSIKREKEILSKQLLEVKFIEKVYPSNANFILIKVDNATKRYNQLLANGFVIRNRSSQPLCQNCLRITVGNEEENKQLIKTLKTIQNG